MNGQHDLLSAFAHFLVGGFSLPDPTFPDVSGTVKLQFLIP